MLYSSMTAALEGGEWSSARPGRNLPPGKTRYPFYRRLRGPHVRSGRAENLVPTGIFLNVSLLALIRYRINRLIYCSLLVRCVVLYVASPQPD